jgi:purine-binding chemotaxis protein CheW
MGFDEMPLYAPRIRVRACLPVGQQEVRGESTRELVLNPPDRLQLVVFRLDGHRYALPLDVVERIVYAVEVTPLPGAPPVVLGGMDLAGQVFPVLDTRRRFRLPEREISPADQFLIARAGRRTVVLVVDEAQDVIECPDAKLVKSAEIAPGLEQFQGALTLDDGLVLIHDLERFLSLDEARAVDEALGREPDHGA